VIVRELFPGKNELEIDPNTSSVAAGQIWYPKISGARFNFVIHPVNHEYQNSDSISNAIDRYFLKVIRSQCDLIITSGKTAKTEALNSSKFAPIAIITNHPDQLLIPATLEPSSNQVIVCSQTVPSIAFQNTNVKFQQIHSLQIAEVLDEVIQATGSSSPVVEVGLSTALELAREGYFVELCLSVVSAISLQAATASVEELLAKLELEVELLQTLCCIDTFLFRFKALK
jgi:riboflavin biosynthesis pyrimidine reductase